jgi:hypothetical protein
MIIYYKLWAGWWNSVELKENLQVKPFLYSCEQNNTTEMNVNKHFSFKIVHFILYHWLYVNDDSVGSSGNCFSLNKMFQRTKLKPWPKWNTELFEKTTYHDQKKYIGTVFYQV